MKVVLPEPAMPTQTMATGCFVAPEASEAWLGSVAAGVDAMIDAVVEFVMV